MQLLSGELFPQPESTEAIFQRVYTALSRRPAAPCVRLIVRPYVATMGKIRLLHGVLEVRLSQIMAAAPSTVREALAWILLSRLFRQAPPPHWVRHYRHYLNLRDVRRVWTAMRSAGGRKYVSGPEGAVFDLDRLFVKKEGSQGPERRFLDHSRDRQTPGLLERLDRGLRGRTEIAIDRKLRGGGEAMV